MSTFAECVSQSERPGYWAVQIRLEAASDVSRRYLCHAPNQRAAAAIAAQLMGAAPNVRGFELSWIDEALLEREGSALPVSGGQRTVPDALEWEQLVAIAERSKAEPTQRALL